MNESTIEKKVCSYAKEMGWTFVKMGGAGNRGMPDRMFIRGGKVFFIEFKTEKGTLSSMQQLRIDRMKAEALDVYVVRSVDDGIKIIRDRGALC